MMRYTKLPQLDEREIELKERKAELEDFTHYPTKERVPTAIAKIFMALLIGGSTVVSLVMLGTAVPIMLTIGFFVGAFAYALNAIIDIYAKREEEKQLIQELCGTINNLGNLFEEDLLLDEEKPLLRELRRALCHFNAGLLDAEQTNQLYANLYELRRVFTIVFPDVNQKKEFTTFIETQIDRVSASMRGQSTKAERSLPDDRYSLIDFAPKPVQEKKFWLAHYAGNAIKPTLAFMGGVSSAVSVGIGVAGFVFGVSNPIGWTYLAIVGVALLVGAMAVAVDYYASRRENVKIKALHSKNWAFSSLFRGVNRVANHLEHTNNTAATHERDKAELVVGALMEKRQLETEKNTALRRVKNLEKLNALPNGTLFRQADKRSNPDLSPSSPLLLRHSR